MQNSFVSHVNGIRFEGIDPLTASLLSKNDKKDIIGVHVDAKQKGKNKSGQGGKDGNEQEIK